MTKEEIIEHIKTYCPEAINSEKVIDLLNAFYCEDKKRESFLDMVKKMSIEERRQLSILEESLETCTVEYLVEYLKNNFNLDDKVCYMDYISGVKYDCTYVTKDQLGKRFLYTVLDLKKEAVRAHGTTLEQEDIYPYVSDNDVILI